MQRFKMSEIIENSKHLVDGTISVENNSHFSRLVLIYEKENGQLHSLFALTLTVKGAVGVECIWQYNEANSKA